MWFLSTFDFIQYGYKKVSIISQIFMCQMKWAHHDLPKSVANSVEWSRQRKFDEINVPFQFIEYDQVENWHRITIKDSAYIN
jgi:hypothetical protein